MSAAAILSALQAGAMTNAQLREATGLPVGAITKICRRLMGNGEVIRLDGSKGSGCAAVYALPGTVASPRPAYMGTREREDAIMDLWDHENLNAAQIAQRLGIRQVNVQSILNYMREGVAERSLSEPVLARHNAAFVAALHQHYPNGCPA
ncbi:MAG TPA: winged helix-turn-helix domain-containing protein [Sphingobium sp.]